MLPAITKKTKVSYKARFDKVFYEKLFKDLFSHTYSIRFWDGEEATYGDGDSKFKIILNEPLPISSFS